MCILLCCDVHSATKRVQIFWTDIKHVQSLLSFRLPTLFWLALQLRVDVTEGILPLGFPLPLSPVKPCLSSFVLLCVFYSVWLVFVALCSRTQSRGINTLGCKAWKQKKVDAWRHWLSCSAGMSSLSSSELTLAHCVMHLKLNHFMLE